jgi:alkylation response protein AidB-like acyl-CoA dehydrogenase
MGAQAADPQLHAWADTADKQSPVLRSFDPLGRRIDRVDYHPAYRSMEQVAYGSGMIALKYDPALRAEHGVGLQVAGFALAFLFSQAEVGLVCPVCMTDGVARLLELYGSAEQKARCLPRLTARELGPLYRGAMFLTEKQGGSDVGQVATRAVPAAGGGWALHGEKWFCSNVDAEAILALARPEGAPAGTRGLGLFLVLRDRADGSRNALRINRLKDKLGVRSMPTGEVELDGADAELVGELGAGFKQMADMLNLSRLYNALCSVAIVRRAAFEATDYLRARDSFGRPAVEHPLVRETLADLNAEEVGAKHALFALIQHLDRGDRGGAGDRLLARVLTPLLKYTTAKLAVWAASEGIELMGGNGYIEDSVMPRLLRDAQVLPVWEGTTNILVLDSLRACARDGAGEALLDETARLLAAAPAWVGEDSERTARLLAWTRAELAALAAKPEQANGRRARRLTDRMMLAYQLARLGAAAAGDGTPPRIAAAALRRLQRRHLDPELPPADDELVVLVDAPIPRG